MPYINQDRRNDFQALLDMARLQRIDTPGELNYFFSVAAHEYLKQHGYNYTQMNAVVGVYECSKDEFIRQFLHPYEDEKKATNGDVFIDETQDSPLATE